MSGKGEIQIAFDEEMQDYYVVWETVIISAGKTKREALDDLRLAAHFGADTFIDLKLEDINKTKED